jgi:GntR family transcriptional repressor for pyruvate dehydrogenase complex
VVTGTVTERPLFQSVQSAKLSTLISRQLLATIIAGHYKAGDMLPPERDLAAMFGVSRVVVREAITPLVARSIVTVRQGRGTTVNPLSEWNTLDPEVLLMLHGASIFPQLAVVRRILEPEIAALAAKNITPEQLEELRSLSDLPDTDTVEQHVARDTTFHLMIAKATHNEVLPILLMSISELLSEVRRRNFHIPGEVMKAREWHQRIYHAIEQRDSEVARRVMADHLSQVETALVLVESVPAERPEYADR